MHVIGGIIMPKANKKIKTPPVTSHEFDTHSKDDALTLPEDEKQLVNELASVIPNPPEHSPFEESFSSLPIDISGEGYRFHNLMEHESLTREERQFIDEPLPDPIFHQQTNEEPISPTEPGPSFVVDRQKTSNLVEGNVGNNAYQLLYEIFGPIPSREGKNKRLSQELRNQIEEALTIPYTKQKHVATFFGVSLTTVKEIEQKLKRSKQLADIAKPVASRSSPTLSSNQTNER
ncbi:hypothetical protein CUS93_09000 [Enterococcus faecium]|nr:hypothetical protein CUS93_09000 [Enterococcus faecium]